MTPFSHAGIEHACPTCLAEPGERCVSRTGRTLKVTHDNRMRAATAAAEFVRLYVTDQLARRVS